MDKELKHLLRLLDDESEQSASMAMASILEKDRGGKLEVVLRRLQETANSRLRRRVHQLQSIMTLRRRRKVLAQRLEGKDMELLEGLIELHLLWYDNDSPEAVRKDWEALLEESKSFRPSNLDRLAYFMRKKGFSCPGKDDIEADYFCLGTILEEYAGSDFALCAIAKLLAAAWDLKLKITQLSGDFVLVDESGHALHPANDWKIAPVKRGYVKEWDVQAMLRLVASTLFVCAVSTDSFRYVHTIGSCLARACGSDGLDSLPYPYNSAPAESSASGAKLS